MSTPPRRLAIELSHPNPNLSMDAASFPRLFSVLPDLTVTTAHSFDELSSLVERVDYVATWRFPVDWYEKAKRLKAVISPAAGRDWVAVDPTGRVPVHYGTFHGPMIAESLLTAMLHFTGRMGSTLQLYREKKWDSAPYIGRPMLGSHRVVIVGYGHIGRHCGARLRAFGCRVTGVRRQAGFDNALHIPVVSFSDAGEALSKADHLVLLLPGGEETRGIVSRQFLAPLKPGAFLYNYGRGTIIAPELILELLNKEILAGACLDVTDPEPLPAESPLWDRNTVIITPHSSCSFAQYASLFEPELIRHLRAAEKRSGKDPRPVSNGGS